MTDLSNFPIPLRELNEILYDYLDPSVKPTFSIMFYTKTVKKETVEEETVEEEKIELIRVTCLKCSGIVRNPNFTETGTQRPFFKKSNYINLFSTPRIKDEVNRATYFKWSDHKNKITKGHYDFAQLSNRQKFVVANIIFEENQKDIPEFFNDCVLGDCQIGVTVRR